MDHDGTTLPAGVRGEVLADGHRWGDRFVAFRGVPTDPDWTCAAQLFGAGLPRALARVGEARGTESPAVAATLLLDVYAQRLAAPVLASFVLERRFLDPCLASVSVQPAGGGFRRLAFAHDPRPVGTGVTRRGLRRGLFDEHLNVVVDVLHRHTRAGTRVLRGTLANAVAITLLHLSWPGPDRARFVGAAQDLLDDVPELAGLATVAAIVEAGEPWMYTDRAACCLAFRTSVNQERDQPYCSTCPVLGQAATRRLFSQATASYRERHP